MATKAMASVMTSIGSLLPTTLQIRAGQTGAAPARMLRHRPTLERVMLG